MDCMKMWPWMRDLPTSVWAGRGWAFDENGLRRLSSTGGSGAMQGVEVFESVGAAAEELKPKDAIVREAASAASHGELPVASAEGPKPTKFLRHNLVKQSGVQNVRWHPTCQAWSVDFRTYNQQGRKTGKTGRMFSVAKFMVNGRSEAEADAAALEAAKAFRAELARKGILEEPKERDPNFTSDVPGVRWSKRDKKWRVQISLKQNNPKERSKLIEGGYFTEKAAAEHPVGAARVRAEGAVCWGQLEPGRAAVACLVHRWWCEPQFQSEAQESLRGRAGAFFPSGSGLEEEAGEGTREDGKVQTKAPEEAAQVQKPQVLSCIYIQGCEESSLQPARIPQVFQTARRS